MRNSVIVTAFCIFFIELIEGVACEQGNEYRNSEDERNSVEDTCFGGAFVLRDHRESGENLYNTKSEENEGCERFKSADTRHK